MFYIIGVFPGFFSLPRHGIHSPIKKKPLAVILRQKQSLIDMISHTSSPTAFVASCFIAALSPTRVNFSNGSPSPLAMSSFLHTFDQDAISVYILFGILDTCMSTTLALLITTALCMIEPARMGEGREAPSSFLLVAGSILSFSLLSACLFFCPSQLFSIFNALCGCNHGRDYKWLM